MSRITFHCSGCDSEVSVPCPPETPHPVTDDDFSALKLEFQTAHEIRAHVDALVTL
jgi:hypothetical protein